MQNPNAERLVKKNVRLTHWLEGRIGFIQLGDGMRLGKAEMAVNAPAA